MANPQLRLGKAHESCAENNAQNKVVQCIVIVALVQHFKTLLLELQVWDVGLHPIRTLHVDSATRHTLSYSSVWFPRYNDTGRHVIGLSLRQRNSLLLVACNRTTLVLSSQALYR